MESSTTLMVGPASEDCLWSPPCTNRIPQIGNEQKKITEKPPRKVRYKEDTGRATNTSRCPYVYRSRKKKCADRIRSLEIDFPPVETAIRPLHFFRFAFFQDSNLKPLKSGGLCWGTAGRRHESGRCRFLLPQAPPRIFPCDRSIDRSKPAIRFWEDT